MSDRLVNRILRISPWACWLAAPVVAAMPFLERWKPVTALALIFSCLYGIAMLTAGFLLRRFLRVERERSLHVQ